MNVFNRIVVVVLCFALIGLSAAVVALAWTSAASSIDSLQDGVDWLSRHNQESEKRALAAIAIGASVAALIVLFLEARPRRQNYVKLSDAQTGDAVLSTSAISQQVEEAVLRVPYIQDVHADVRAKRGGALLSMDIRVDPQADLATATDDACQAARDVLTERLHVRLLSLPAVHVHYTGLRGRRAQPAPVPAVAAAGAQTGQRQSLQGPAGGAGPPPAAGHDSRDEDGEDEEA